MIRRTITLLLLTLGIIAIVLGVAIGSVTHHVSYRHVENARILHYLFIRDDQQHNPASIQLANSDTLYTLPTSNFTPELDGDQLLREGYVYVSFDYDAGRTIHVDKMASNTGVHLVGEAYRIVSITFYDKAGYQRVFSSSEYTQHPQGYDYNTWPAGFITIGVGTVLLVLGIVLFVMRRRAPSIAPAP